MISHVRETLPGVAGNVTSSGAFTVAYLTTDVLPWLHVVSILAGIIASVATTIYYIYKMRK